MVSGDEAAVRARGNENVSEDPVDRLQRLSDLHRSGDLSDEEFAAAKQQVLEGPDRATAPTPVQWSQPAGTTRPARAAKFGLTGSPRSSSRRPGVWRRPWVVLTALFCGLMFASAFTAATPSSALWAGRFLCDSPEHLEHQTADTSYGTTSQASISFFCVSDTGADEEAGTFSIFGLQFLLGALVAYVVLVVSLSGFALLTRRA